MKSEIHLFVRAESTSYHSMFTYSINILKDRIVVFAESDASNKYINIVLTLKSTFIY